MRRLLFAAVLGVVCAAPVLPRAQDAVTEPASGFVFVAKPGRSPLKESPSLGAKNQASVAYGQKLAVKEKQKVGEEVRWLHVAVPGDTSAGWILANAVLDRRPAIKQVPVAAGAARVVAAEGSSATAIRGLDGRTAAYAKEKQIPADALAQLARAESQTELLFQDPHFVNPKGEWRYRDRTVPGRWSAAAKFARPEGLKAPRPEAPDAPKTPEKR